MVTDKSPWGYTVIPPEDWTQEMEDIYFKYKCTDQELSRFLLTMWKLSLFKFKNYV